MDYHILSLFFAVIFGSSTALLMVDPVVKGLVVDCRAIKSFLGIEYQKLKYTDAEPDVKSVKLCLYSDKSGQINFTLPGAAGKLLQSTKFDRNLPTVIYAHGWMETPNDLSIQTMIKTFITKGGHNVFLLDSTKLLSNRYFYSSTAAHFIGDALGKELTNLVKGGYPREKINLIGIGLGGHIVGFTGKMFRALSGVLLPRITGLDPAGPCYYENNESLRLDRSDAQFVEVIHTSAGILGMEKAIGHADFYPNSGYQQPGCMDYLCIHHRAWEYYSESILQEQNFLAVTCPSWLNFVAGGCFHKPRVVMGYATPNNTRGIYYLKTNAHKPFGLKNQSIPESFLNFLFPDLKRLFI